MWSKGATAPYLPPMKRQSFSEKHRTVSLHIFEPINYRTQCLFLLALYVHVRNTETLHWGSYILICGSSRGVSIPRKRGMRNFPCANRSKDIEALPFRLFVIVVTHRRYIMMTMIILYFNGLYDTSTKLPLSAKEEKRIPGILY